MSDSGFTPPPADVQASAPADPARKAKKKKDKVRSAWISFIGRIVAQVVGAAASIALGVLVIQKSRAPEPATTVGTAATPAPATAAPTATPAETGVAVLPLDNFSGDPAQEFFADGMTEALIADLAQIRTLRVISRTSAMQYKDARKPITEIARELGVQYVVEGSVMRAGDSVRITAQLIDARTDTHLWAKNYTRTARDVLALQAEVAGAIAKELHGALEPLNREAFARRAPVQPQVYDLYLKGRQTLRRDTSASQTEATKLFEQAIAADPNFAQAHAGLADTYVLRGLAIYWGIHPREALDRGRTAARRAIELDPLLPDAHEALATLELFYGWDWKAAERSFRTAIELNPGHTPSLHWYAVYLASQGRMKDAVRVAERAVAIDPLSSQAHRGLAVVRYVSRDFVNAEAAARKAIAIDPSSAVSVQTLARSLVFQGRAREGVDLLLAAPKDVLEVDEVQATLAWAYARAGDQETSTSVAAALVSKQRPPPPPILARLYASLGQADAAMAHLDRAVEDRSAIVASLVGDPLFDGLRKDARFVALLKRLNLPS